MDFKTYFFLNRIFKWQYLSINFQIKHNSNQNSSIFCLFVYFRIWQAISKVHMKCKEPKIAETILKKKNKVAGFLLSKLTTDLQ